MNYEEKYKEALERAKNWYIDAQIDFKKSLETLFPELAESEDEKIRKEIVNAIHDYAYRLEEKIPTEWFAWLEEQGKQKSVDEAEPKFKAGDWITNGRYTRLIVNINSDWAYYMFKDGTSKWIKDIDKKYRLWTIQDAKDGDVLVGSYGTFIFMSKSAGYCGILSDNTFIRSTGNNEWTEGLHPATKEQRDLLFEKMKEVGYEWDGEKKELKKVVAPIFHIGDRVRYKGHACDGVITEITETDYICGDAKLPISTQDKLELVEQKTAWGEEDKENMNNVLYILNQLKDATSYEEDNIAEKTINWLKSLKGRVYPKQECNGENEIDKEILNAAILFAMNSTDEFACNGVSKEDVIDWLKSLRFQNHWKPSDRQMDSITCAVKKMKESACYDSELVSLLNDLKKLKEG